MMAIREADGCSLERGLHPFFGRVVREYDRVLKQGGFRLVEKVPARVQGA